MDQVRSGIVRRGQGPASIVSVHCPTDSGPALQGSIEGTGAPGCVTCASGGWRLTRAGGWRGDRRRSSLGAYDFESECSEETHGRIRTQLSRPNLPSRALNRRQQL